MVKKIKLPVGMEPPNHVAVIPDGNRRWARNKGLPTLMGHRKGFDRAVEIVRTSRKLEIHTLTFWGFSTENWNRSKTEINYLMKLYHDMIDRNLKEAHKHHSKMVHLGRKDRLPRRLMKKIENAERETRGYKEHILNIALDYGGQDDILRAIVKLRKPGIKDQDLWKEVGKQGKYPIYKFSEYLDTAGQPYPYPDLMIRTSGELRTSGLLLWQAAYSEFYFEKKHFPDFTPERFTKAVVEFSKRSRRFGGN